MLILLFLFALFRRLQGAPLAAHNVDDLIDTFPTVHNLPRRSDVVFGTRTTSDIVTSCLATIFACTWTAIHPNIPSPVDSRWNIFKRRLVTTIYALLAPEFITLWAFRQYVGANRIMEEYNTEIAKLPKRHPTSKLECLKNIWVRFKTWISSAFSTCQNSEAERQPSSRRSYSRKNWFGAKILWSGPMKLWAGIKKLWAVVRKWLNDAPPVPVGEGKIEPWTATHGFFIQMGGFTLCENGKPVQSLSFSMLKDKIQREALQTPSIMKAEIEDRSKGDPISKTLVILQTTWFATQCIARWSTQIPVTELEVLTLGFAALNGLTYALWWNKPQNVGVPVYLEGGSVDSRDSTEELDPVVTDSLIDPDAHDAPPRFPEVWDLHRGGLRLLYAPPILLLLSQRLIIHPVFKLINNVQSGVGKGELRVAMFFADTDTSTSTSTIIFVNAIAALFGCIHFIPSFFFRYPSTTEMWLWRISAAVITMQPPISTLTPYLYAKIHPHIQPIFDRIEQISQELLNRKVRIVKPLQSGVFPYLLARIVLIILSFLSLRDLPENAHLAIDWISSIPHL